MAAEHPEGILGLSGIQGSPGESPAAPGILANLINPAGAERRTATAGPWITSASGKGQRRESGASSRAQAPP